ncbi:threonine ammonia-lyase IlvA [Actinobaculum suis]|uniref:threonine ammonia-lyase IlvA n=1 Tax=Actinobaculum suis TaxID=1657 RepID=UPI0008086CB7|nr:threonine ammonia-lyase IlvA [Actinobaculum suis]OCA95108.1 threonine dehydratase [Actinobaculum suis]OCA95574.1 threonine dehydratase [Actinobaculum suis]
MANLPSGADVVVASQTLGGIVRRTPLQLSERLSEIRGRQILLKREDLQVGRSYKVRGAYNFISSLGPEEREAGVICASAGNHAQGVAFSCNKLKIRGKIYLPSTTPRQKRDRIADIGGGWAEQIIGGATFDEAAAAALTAAHDTGATFVHPFDDPRTICGQGTVIKEAFEQCVQEYDAEPVAVIVPVGGGGLLAGIGTWIQSFHPNVRVIGAESDGAMSMQAAWDAGKPVSLPNIDTFADGTAVGRVGDITYQVSRRTVDHLVHAPEGAICTEMLDLYQVEGIIAEPSGALASAAARRFTPELDELPEGPVICIVSGGNNDVSRYADIIERSMVYEGLRHYFLVTFAQEPGALRRFLDKVLADGEDIIQFEYTKKNNRETGPALVGIDIAQASDIDSLMDRIAKSGLQIEKLEPNSPTFQFFM